MQKSLVWAAYFFLVGVILTGCSDTQPAQPPQPPQLTAEVDLNTQTMTVKHEGKTLYNWKVSTGRRGLGTPAGSYRPQRMHTMWYSRKYNYVPMPYAIFFKGGYAIHGTKAVGALGSPVSHGCVRLATKNAGILYQLVRETGMDNVAIIIRK